MKDDVMWIAVAESSAIVRHGMLEILKHFPDTTHTVQLIEITSLEALDNCMQARVPDMLIIDPAFEGWFNIDNFRAEPTTSGVKCIALLCSMVDQNLLRKYDDFINLYDDEEAIYGKIHQLLVRTVSEAEADADSLSQREREIIICVVKGMTNKEIAEKLYISIHTVITHRRNIARKLQIHSPAGLTIYAIVNNLVELSDVKM